MVVTLQQRQKHDGMIGFLLSSYAGGVLPSVKNDPGFILDEVPPSRMTQMNGLSGRLARVSGELKKI